MYNTYLLHNNKTLGIHNLNAVCVTSPREREIIDFQNSTRKIKLSFLDSLVCLLSKITNKYILCDERNCS